VLDELPSMAASAPPASVLSEPLSVLLSAKPVLLSKLPSLSAASVLVPAPLSGEASANPPSLPPDAPFELEQFTAVPTATIIAAIQGSLRVGNIIVPTFHACRPMAAQWSRWFQVSHRAAIEGFRVTLDAVPDPKKQAVSEVTKRGDFGTPRFNLGGLAE
jgi:hypothetical protein